MPWTRDRFCSQLSSPTAKQPVSASLRPLLSQSANMPYPWVFQGCDSQREEWTKTELITCPVCNLAFVKIRYFSVVRVMYSQNCPWRGRGRSLDWRTAEILAGGYKWSEPPYWPQVLKNSPRSAVSPACPEPVWGLGVGGAENYKPMSYNRVVTSSYI